MAYFAKLGNDNKVVTVERVADGAAATEAKGEAFLNRLYGTNDVWKQCSYNTREGVQLKFLVMLSQPQRPVSPDQNWRWQAFLGSIGIVVVAWGVGGFIFAAMKKA